MPQSESHPRDALEKELDELRARVDELEAECAEKSQLVAASRDGEARYRALIEQASDAIGVCDIDGNMLDANAACVAMLGYSVEELRRIGLFALVHPDDLAARPIRKERVRAGVTVRGVRRFVRKDGTGFLGETSTKRLEDGRVQFVVRDISQQVQAEQDVKREATYVHLLQKVAMAANEATGWSDALSRCLAAVCDAMGWDLGHVYVPDLANPERLVSSHLWHALELPRFAPFCAATERTALRRGDGLSGRAFESGSPEWVADLSIDPRCAARRPPPRRRSCTRRSPVRSATAARSWRCSSSSRSGTSRPRSAPARRDDARRRAARARDRAPAQSRRAAPRARGAGSAAPLAAEPAALRGRAGPHHALQRSRGSSHCNSIPKP